MAHDEDLREEEAARTIHKNVLWCVGIGFIPFPVLDMLALTGVQLKMLAELADLHGVSFSENSGKSAIGALAGGIGPHMLARGAVGSLVKSIPLVGTIAGMLTMPVLAGAATYAVGRVFHRHFASGGTFLTFDPEKVRAYYEEKFAEGKKMVKILREEKKGKRKKHDDD
jgi:uncharacterized protein (DUF697 family)